MDRNEAIKIVKSHYPANKQMLNEALELLIPELKESEDEKTRKWLIAQLKIKIGDNATLNNMIYKAIAWLENIPYTIDHEKREGFHLGYKAGLEKQGKQKPADKVEPKFKVRYAGSEYNVFETKDIDGVTFYGIEDEPNHIDYVKADNCEIISGYGIKDSGLSIPTKPVMFSGKNPKRMISAEAKEALYDKPACAWSEKDENVLEDIKEAIINYWGGDTQDIILDWLKSLKERMKGE